MNKQTFGVINANQRQVINDVLHTYSDMFLFSDILSLTNLAVHHIEIDDAVLVRQKPYRIQHAHKQLRYVFVIQS